MRRLVALAALGMAALLAAACQGQSSPSPSELSADQTLRLAITSDIDTLDPAQLMQPSVGLSLVRNIFGGLYTFADNLEEVPDIASGPPEVTADGLTWTFKLRANATFSNGDPVRAKDFIYSWSRAASRQNDDATVFEVIRGYDEVHQGKTATLAGLSAPDGQTLVASLIHPAGWWLIELGLWPAWVIDEAVVKARGDTTWWSTPEGLVGTGPFRMRSWEPGKSLDFEPVPNWWRGPTGSLRVRAEVVPDRAEQVKRYEEGRYDIVGYAPESTVPSLTGGDLLHYRQKPDFVSRPWLRTDYVLFNFHSGPFSGLDRDRDGRRAFSLAIDRKTLALNTCVQATTCQPATGGLIAKGLAGYLGDGNDANAAYRPADALAALKRWDPDGSRVRGLRVAAPPGFADAARELVRQWKANLHVDVGLDLPDRTSFLAGRDRGLYPFFVGGWLADYDSPHDWLYYLFASSAFAANGYQNPAFDPLIRKADAELPGDGLKDYLQAGKMLVADVAYIPLVYRDGIYLVKPYVKGAGGNALYENYWSGISIRRH